MARFVSGRVLSVLCSQGTETPRLGRISLGGNCLGQLPGQSGICGWHGEGKGTDAWSTQEASVALCVFAQWRIVWVSTV